MSDDNLGNFFNADDFDGNNECDENWKPLKINGNLLFKKAIDILNLTTTLCDVLPDEDDADGTRRLMLDNAMIVPGKIRGAMAVDHIYSVVMENAVIIKVNMVQLKEQLWACSAIHGIEEKYLDVLRNEIEEFRKIFVQWVSAFNRENDMPDNWNLFNNPSNFPEI